MAALDNVQVSAGFQVKTALLVPITWSSELFVAFVSPMALRGLQEGPKNALPDGTRYEYDPILKRTVEVAPSGERIPVTLVDGKLRRDSQKVDKRKGEAA